MSDVIKPRLDNLLEQVDSHYAVVIVAAKRARQINSYYHNLGEGTFDEYPPPMVDTGSKNYLKIALEEIAAGRSSTATAQRTIAGPVLSTFLFDGTLRAWLGFSWGDRWDRRLQGGGACAPGHGGRAFGAGGADAGFASSSWAGPRSRP